MGPISQGNKANSRPRIPSKTKAALDIESSSIKILRKTQKSCFQNTGNASSPRSVSQLNGDRDHISKDENSSTITLGSPRSSRGFPVKSITKYTNQACEAFESRQYNLAMRLFQDAHNLLHDYRNRRASRDGSKVVSSAVQTRQRNIESPSVSDVDFLPTNSYIYQRLDFDEGMCTYSEPMKVFDDRSCKTNEITMNALIWYNKGHMYCRCNMWDTAICCFQSALDESAHDESEDIQSGQIHVAALQSLAQIQNRLGKFKESIALYKRAISYAKTIYGEVHESIGAALNSLSVLCYHLMTSGGKNVDNAKKSDEYLKYANKYSKRSLEIRIQTLGFNHKDVGTTYNNIGRLHVMQGQFKEALECYEKALSIRAKTLTKRSLDYAATAFNAGQSYHHIHELSKALKYYREFLSVAVKRFTKNHRDVAVVLSGIAEIHQERGEMEEALKLYEESLEAGRNALGEDHPEVAMILNRLGNFHFVMENFDAAYDVYEQGLKIEKGHHDDANGIVSLCNLGEIHRQRKEWSAAVKVFRAVLKIQRKKYGNHVQNSEIATTLNVIGLTYDKKGDTHTALRYLQEALLMRRMSLGERHIDVAPTLTTIGIILYRSNKFTIAMDLLNEALGIRLSVLGRDHRDIAFTMYNIALIHQKQGSLAEAIKCLLEVLRIEEKVFGSEHKDVAITLFKLGETFKRQNDLERALYYYEKALQVERKVTEDNDLLTVARTLTEIGNIHLSRGQRVEMMNAFNEAARIYQCCSMSPRDVAVATNLYAIDLVCPRGAPAA